MRKTGMIGIALAASMAVGGCATDRYGYGYDDPYGQDRGLGRTATGAAVGAAGGAAAGAIIPGVSTIEGAIAGAVLGGVAGAVSGSNERWYRDQRGYCFYVNDRGERIYDSRVRC